MTNESPKDPVKRDFIMLSATAVAGLGGIAATWPLLDSLNPSADVLALASIEVDVSSLESGQSIKVMWRGKPVFIRRRTAKEVAEAKATPIDQLPDPQTDAERVLEGKDEWLVVVGQCTHLGCVPLGQAGEFNGWFCPCHGSHYDTSGRIRKGPAPLNLPVPPYDFITESIIRIG